jgi:hypothetical protein
VDARTVLAVKGSLRRAKPGSPLTAPRRSGRMVIATGGSGGNTSAMPAKTKKAGLPPAEESRPKKQNPSDP